MNELPYDPESLADELDRVLPPGQAWSDVTSDDPLIQAAIRLNDAPHPTLSPEAFARIRMTVLAVPVNPPPPWRSFARSLPPPTPSRLALAAMLALVFVTSVMFVAGVGVQLLGSALETLVPPTLTPLAVQMETETPIPPLPTSSRMATLQSSPVELPAQPTALIPTILPTDVVPTTAPPTTIPPTTAPPTTVPPTPAPPTAVPELTGQNLPATVVVEGPVQSITDNRIVIFDLTITLNPSDPMLPTLRVGDTVRVEGSLAPDGTINATSVTVLGVEISVNPADAQVIWRDPGDCTNPPPPWAPANGWRRRCEQPAPNPQPNPPANPNPQPNPPSNPRDCSNPPPPWAEANGWRRRCEQPGRNPPPRPEHGNDDDDDHDNGHGNDDDHDDDDD